MALDMRGDVIDLLRQLIDIPSESRNEDQLATQVAETLSLYSHLDVVRYGNAVVARTHGGRADRVAVAGHLDTVPIAGNVPSWLQTDDGQERVYGRGSCDQLGGIAVQLLVATELATPKRDVTWIFYDCEEIDHASNGLGRLQREHPEIFDASFAVLTEPTGGLVEGGCQGTLRARLSTAGKAAHTARPWMGSNAIHSLTPALDTLVAYEPRQPVVEGLAFREALNAVRIGGGHAGNVIPDAAWIEVNLRYAPDRSSSDAEAYVRDLFGGYEVTIVDNAAAARPGLDLPQAADFVASVGSEPRAKLGWTDVSRFSSMGIPAVNFVPGDPVKAHADDEYVPVEQVVNCHDALRRWLDDDE